MHMTEDSLKRIGAILLALAIPGMVYLIIVYLLLPGFVAMPMQEQLKSSMEMLFTTVVTSYGLMFGVFFAYTLLSTIRHKPLYISSQPVKLEIIKKNMKHERFINTFISVCLAGFFIWYIARYHLDTERLLFTFFNLSVYLPIFIIIPSAFLRSRITFYEDRFKHGLKIYHGYDIGMIQLNEETVTISFKHVNTRYQFNPPADQLYQHYESLLRCTGKQ